MRPLLCCVAVPIAVAVALPALAGELNPPGGPVQETGRFTINPQSAVFPIQINQPGSYVLLGDLTVGGAVNGIHITADDVTLDLNGFTLDGAGVAIEGIFVNGVNSNVAIRNGTVRNCTQGGVFAPASRIIVEDLRSYDNGFEGINVGANGVIRRCVADGNNTGFYLGVGSRIEDCGATGNASSGIYTRDNVLIRGCDVLATPGVGITVGADCQVVDNRVQAQGAGGGALAGINQRPAGFGRSLIDSNYVSGYNPGIRVDPAIVLGEVAIVRNVVLNALGFFGYQFNGNFMPSGLSSNPDTADAWDNIGWVSVTRDGEIQGEDLSKATPRLGKVQVRIQDPRAYRSK